jgi:uncharacterized membrane protein YdcZ (DUF606 family)
MTAQLAADLAAVLMSLAVGTVFLTLILAARRKP